MLDTIINLKKNISNITIVKRIFTYFIVIFLTVINPALANGIFSSAKEQAQVLQRINLPSTSYQIGMETAKWAPFYTKAPHIHTGPELVYVLEGEVILDIKGQPAKIFIAGESFQTPPNVVHSTKAGPNGAKVLAVWAVKQGEPVSIPAS